VTLRVGVVATPYGEHAIDFVRQAERLGVDSVWVPEFWAGDALTPLAFLAAQTSTIRLATGIVQLGARTPAMLAMSAMSLQALSNGRFVLGIGVSHGPIVDARGHRYQRPLDKMRGYLDAMDAAPWQGPPLSEEPPLVLAALGTRMLELAAERSAGALLYNGTPEATATARSVLGPGPLLAVEQAVLLEEDPAEARGICREFLTLYLTLPNYLGAWDRAGLGPEEQAEGGSDRLVDAVVAWGGPEVITERVRAHLDAGADHVCVQVLDPDPNGLPMTSWRALTPALLER